MIVALIAVVGLCIAQAITHYRAYQTWAKERERLIATTLAAAAPPAAVAAFRAQERRPEPVAPRPVQIDG